MELPEAEKKRQTGIIKQLVDAAAPAREPSKTMGARGGRGALTSHFDAWEAKQIQGFESIDVTTQDLQQLEELAYDRTTASGEVIKGDEKVKEALERQRDALQDGGTALLKTPDLVRSPNGTVDRASAQNKAIQQEIDDRKTLANALIESRLVKEKQVITAKYVEGAAEGKSTSVDGDNSMIHQITGMMGLGGGIFGLLTGLISKIPVVGDYMVAAGLMMGSAVESLLGKVGIGDKDAKFKSFGEALQEVRDSKRFGGGMEAVAGMTGVDASLLLSDIKATAAGNAPAVDPVEQPAAKVAAYEINVSGISKPLETATLADFEKTVNATQAAATDEATKKALGDLNAAIAKDRGNAALKDKDSFMMVKMPDGSLALAAGNIDDTGSKHVDAVLLQPNAEGKLAVVKDAPKVNALQTGRQMNMATMGLSTESKPDMNTLVPSSLADNFQDFQERIAEEVVRDKAANKRDSSVLLDKMILAIGDDPKTKLPGILPENSVHMLVKTADNRIGIVSGTFNKNTDTFVPKQITLMKDNGSFEKTTNYNGKTNAISVSPQIDGGNVIGGLRVKSIEQLEKEMAAAKESGMQADTIEPRTFSQNIAELLTSSADKLDPSVAAMLKGAQDSITRNKPDMRFVVMAKPGGERVVVGGTVEGVELKPDVIYEMEKGAATQTPAPQGSKAINIVDGLRVPQKSQTEGFDATTVSPGPVAKGVTLADQQSR